MTKRVATDSKLNRRGVLAHAAALSAAALGARLATGNRLQAATGDTIKVGGSFEATSTTEIGGTFGGQVWSVYNFDDRREAVGIMSTLDTRFATPDELAPSAIFARAGGKGSYGVFAVNVSSARRTADPPLAAIRGVSTIVGDGVSGETSDPFSSGVLGSHPGAGAGVRGESQDGVGVLGVSHSTTAGVSGSSSGGGPGIEARALTNAPAVLARNEGGGGALKAENSSAESACVVGINSGEGDALKGVASSETAAGVVGINSSGGFGVRGEAAGPGSAILAEQRGSGPGVEAFVEGAGPALRGQSLGGDGVIAVSQSAENQGLLALHTGGGIGLRAQTSATGNAIVAEVIPLVDGADSEVSRRRAERRPAPVAARAGATTGIAVKGTTFVATSAAGAFENTGGGDGVVGSSRGVAAAGLRGVNSSGGFAVFGRATGAKAGVFGANSGAGDGVTGRSTEGRGGSFRGKAAALQLVPSRSSDHPVDGRAGDLFVDRTRRLWFCKRGGKRATWVQLA